MPRHHPASPSPLNPWVGLSPRGGFPRPLSTDRNAVRTAADAQLPLAIAFALRRRAVGLPLAGVGSWSTTFSTDRKAMRTPVRGSGAESRTSSLMTRSWSVSLRSRSATGQVTGTARKKACSSRARWPWETKPAASCSNLPAPMDRASGSGAPDSSATRSKASRNGCDDDGRRSGTARSIVCRIRCLSDATAPSSASSARSAPPTTTAAARLVRTFGGILPASSRARRINSSAISIRFTPPLRRLPQKRGRRGRPARPHGGRGRRARGRWGRPGRRGRRRSRRHRARRVRDAGERWCRCG